MKDDKKETSLLNIFSVFAKIGAFTIGGGYAMLPLISDEMKKRGWIPEEDLPDIVALAQSAPGLLAVNISIFAGYKIRGLKGSIAATVGSVLPSFIAILLIAIFFSSYSDNPYVIRIFKGIRPVVVAMILVPMYNMAKKGNSTWWMWTISVCSLILAAFLGVSPIYILIVCGVGAFTVSKYLEGRR